MFLIFIINLEFSSNTIFWNDYVTHLQNMRASSLSLLSLEEGGGVMFSMVSNNQVEHG